MAKVLDEQSRKAVAATVRYYRELGIYDLYRREVPEGMTFGQAIVREELAAIGDGSPAAEALTVDAAASLQPLPMPGNWRRSSATSPPPCA